MNKYAMNTDKYMFKLKYVYTIRHLKTFSARLRSKKRP